MVGLANTATHWAIFCIGVYFIHLGHAISNLLAFAVAATLSFFANAKFTFNEKASGIRYIFFILFMGAISFLAGLISGNYSISPLAMLAAFSTVSLVLGFLFSKFIVFRREGS